MSRVSAVVLAAGLSRRMRGANKLLLPLRGAPLVAHAVGAALASRAAEVVVVTGHDAEGVRGALTGCAVRFAHNPAPEAGLAGSLATGVGALAPGTEGAVICLADMPWVRAAHLDALLSAFEADGLAPICVPVFGGRRGNPVLWPARHFAALAALRGDTGARELLEAHAGEVRRVAVADDGVLRDVDTAEALDEAVP